MGIFRITHNNFETSFKIDNIDTTDSTEWKDFERLNEPGWDDRYDHECEIISKILLEHNYKNILEIGSGPGILSQKIQHIIPYINYDLIDKQYANDYFVKNQLKGSFYIKDISVDLDITDLKPTYDFIICNDVLEHVLCPSNIIQKIYKLLTPTGRLFISIPNWRMAHQMIYRGLFDYDNFLYFMYIHKFVSTNVYPSNLQTPYYPKLDSEKSMPDELLMSWNFYFNFKNIS